HSPTTDVVEEMKRAPWNLLLILKWVCQDRMANLFRGRKISAEEFDDLRQRLWDLPENCELGSRDSLPPRLFFRQVLRPQIEFQRMPSVGAIREAALLMAQPVNSRLRRKFKASTT